ncbi:Fur family transcriptional regulator [Agaribacterium sp. ZY112]|uniref:Fur family transcriptional regulator n=1 Tax=Agaribacterium sp. ZY112 TaxID=3233574 RepID=UPI003524AFFE
MPSPTLPSNPKAPERAQLERLLNTAETICNKAGFKLTELRRQVLSIIWLYGKPIGAYDIMAELEKISDREQVAPPTVYRSVEFLLQQGLIHRIHSLNAFMAKRHLLKNQVEALFICQNCGEAREVTNQVFQQAINLSANEMKFHIQGQAVEVLGQCQNCRNKGSK